jgi:hypothetical protein
MVGDVTEGGQHDQEQQAVPHLQSPTNGFDQHDF